MIKSIRQDGLRSGACQILAVADSTTGSEISAILDSGCCDVLSDPLDPATVEAAERVCGAAGGMGPNEDYVINTAEHIRTLGIRDHWLEHVVDEIRTRAR